MYDTFSGSVHITQYVLGIDIPLFGSKCVPRHRLLIVLKNNPNNRRNLASFLLNDDGSIQLLTMGLAAGAREFSRDEVPAVWGVLFKDGLSFDDLYQLFEFGLDSHEHRNLKGLAIGLCGIGCVAMLIFLGAYQFLFIQQTPEWGEAWLAEKCEDIGLSWNTTDNACEVEPVMSLYREFSKSDVGGYENGKYQFLNAYLQTLIAMRLMI